MSTRGRFCRQAHYFVDKGIPGSCSSSSGGLRSLFGRPGGLSGRPGSLGSLSGRPGRPYWASCWDGLKARENGLGAWEAGLGAWGARLGGLGGLHGRSGRPGSLGKPNLREGSLKMNFRSKSSERSEARSRNIVIDRYMLSPS